MRRRHEPLPRVCPGHLRLAAGATPAGKTWIAAPSPATGILSRRAFLAIAWIGIALSCLPRAWAGETLRFEEMYKASGVLGLEMSDKLLVLNGKPVEIRGLWRRR
jgi:hypothetical protein